MTGPIFAGSPMVEKVQHLSFGFVTVGLSLENIDCTLGVDAGVAVDASRTLLVGNFVSTANQWRDDTGAAKTLDSGVLYLLNDNTVRAFVESDSASKTCTLHFTLVEFYPGMWRRILRGQPSISTPSHTSSWADTDIPIGATVDLAKSMLFVDVSFLGTGWKAADLGVYTLNNQFYLKADGQNIVWRSCRNASAAASTYLISWTILEGH